MSSGSSQITNKLDDLVCSQELYFDLIGFEELSPPEQALIGTWELAAEVHNGGFLQYFHNSSRDHAKPMIAILRSINADRAVAILEEAIGLAGPGTRWGDEVNFITAVNSMPDAVRNRLGEFDRSFYDEVDNLYLQVFRYMSRHRDRFDVPADFWTEAVTP